MKKQQLIFIFLSIFISVSSFAQVLISDKEDKELNSSAILQLDSTVKGFLMPRMTNDETEIKILRKININCCFFIFLLFLLKLTKKLKFTKF